MTKLIMAILMLIATEVRAETNLEKYWKEFYPGEPCVLASKFEFYITKSIGHGLYEIHTPPRRGSRNAVLKMNTKQFTGPGDIIGVKIKYVTSTEMQTASGFPAVYDLVEECI